MDGLHFTGLLYVAGKKAFGVFILLNKRHPVGVVFLFLCIIQMHVIYITCFSFNFFSVMRSDGALSLVQKSNLTVSMGFLS